MEVNVQLEIENLYGGDGFIRTEQRIEEKYATKKTKETKRYENITFDDKAEMVKEQKTINIYTFKKDDEGNFIQRLGGSHGKIWGSFKSVGKFLQICKNPVFNSLGLTTLISIDRMMNTITISPLYPKLDYDKNKVWIDKLPQKMNGIGNTMTFPEYNVVSKAKCNITILVPDIYHKAIIEILRSQELIPTLNKRRSTIKILNKEIFNA